MEESVVCEIPSNAIDKIHRFRQRGFAYISQALKCEETETDIDLVSVLQTFFFFFVTDYPKKKLCYSVCQYQASSMQTCPLFASNVRSLVVYDLNMIRLG